MFLPPKALKIGEKGIRPGAAGSQGCKFCVQGLRVEVRGIRLQVLRV